MPVHALGVLMSLAFIVAGCVMQADFARKNVDTPPLSIWTAMVVHPVDLHHAQRAPRNISVMLSICDRVFGTFQKAS